MPPVVTHPHRPDCQAGPFSPYPRGFQTHDSKTTSGCQVVKGERTTVDTPVEDVDNFWGLWTTGDNAWDIAWTSVGMVGENDFQRSGIGTGVEVVAQHNSGVTSQLSPGASEEVSCVEMGFFRVIHTIHTTTVNTGFSSSIPKLIRDTGHTTGKGCDSDHQPVISLLALPRSPNPPAPHSDRWGRWPRDQPGSRQSTGHPRAAAVARSC